MNRRDFLRTASCLMGGTVLGGLSGCAKGDRTLGFPQRYPTGAFGLRKPNIILILSDDMGYGDIGIHGCPDIPTPNIDSIARGGVRFTDGYVSCPVCSPTRAGLMTGKYQQRFGFEHNPARAIESQGLFGLPVTEETMANRLKAQGYATSLVGKWHLGTEPQFHPQQRGFDEFYGFLGGAHSYLAAELNNPRNAILRGTEKVAEVEYLTDDFTREAISFIERHAEVPFCLYLAYNAVHTPMHTRQKYLDRFGYVLDEKRRAYAAMLAAMDDGVGQVLQRLREKNLEQDTLVFFLNDNGGPIRGNASCNRPFRGEKGQLYEGGIRVPYMMQWKGNLPEGVVYRKAVISLDVHATALAAAGAPMHREMKLDGVNLIPFVTGERPEEPHDCLFWRYKPNSAIRIGDWKMVTQGSVPTALYNLADDPGETTDLSSRHPVKLRQLSTRFGQWNAELREPRWQGRRV